MDKEGYRQLAKDAVLNMLEAEGPAHKFPWNSLREYIDLPPDPNAPLRFAGARQHTMKTGYIKKTGGHAPATTESARSRQGDDEFEFGVQALREGGYEDLAKEKEVARSSASGLLKTLAQRMETEGFIIELPELANFYLALKTSPLVILAGISGTGKSKLPRLFAELTGSGFQHVSVKPQWADNTDLLGYTSALRGDIFVEGEILESIQAARDGDDLTIALLDEMNLAAVEHYFSDFLSVVETRRREGGSVVTDPLPLDLPAPPEEGGDLHADLRALTLPPNFRVVGTANMDETTRLFSPKVLDRAFSIEFGNVDLTAFADTSGQGEDTDVDFNELARRVGNSDATFVSEVYSEAEVLFDRAAELLDDFRQKLYPAASFGYRTRDQILMYLFHWQTDDLADVLDLDAAFDLCLLQKVLPKIGGTSQALDEVLGNAQEWLAKEHGEAEDEATGLTGPFLRSAEKVERMQNQLKTEGATNFWTA